MSNLIFINDPQQLLHCGESWNRLAGDRPLASWEWMATWAERLGKEFSLAILVETDDNGDWIGIAPFCIETTATGTRKLQFLGSGSACTDYASLICNDEHRVQFVRTVACWLRSEIEGSSIAGYDLLELDGVANDDETMNLLLTSLRASQFREHQKDLEGCWAVSLPDTWDELHASFSKSLRRKSKASCKRLASDETRVLSSNDVGIVGLWQTFVQLHQKRRTMLGQPGCFADSDFERFLFASIVRLAARGRAEVVVIEHEDKPLAAMVLLNDGETVMMYQSGFDTERQAMCPGYLMIVQALQDSIARGFKCFDLMRGDEPYKSRWKTVRVPLSRYRMVPPKLTAQLRQNLWESARSVKTMIAQATAR